MILTEHCYNALTISVLVSLMAVIVAMVLLVVSIICTYSENVIETT